MINILEYMKSFDEDDFSRTIEKLSNFNYYDSYFNYEKFQNITPYNGFDKRNPNNARQNNCA